MSSCSLGSSSWQRACTGVDFRDRRGHHPLCISKGRHALHGQVATKVAEEALSQGVGTLQKPSEGLHKFITDRMWDPRKPALNQSSNVDL